MANKGIKGKVIIVTGASSSIGKALAIKLSQLGGIVILTAHRENLLKEISQNLNGKAYFYKADLKNPNEIKNLVDFVMKKFSKIDILVNVAGIGWFNWIEELSVKEINEQFQTNVMGMADLIHEVVPFMKNEKSGHIINVSSYASSIAIPPLTIYASTKYAIEGLTDALRRELFPWNIKVTRVHPWAVDTDFNDKASKNGIPFPMKEGEFFRNWTEVSPEKVADEIVKVIEKPKTAIYISKMLPLIKFIAFVNHHFPGVVDFFYKFYVNKMRQRYKNT